MAFQARYEGKCGGCGEKIFRGQTICTGERGGYRHVGCWNGVYEGDAIEAHEVEQENRRRATANREYAQGVAQVEQWRLNKQLFGEAYAGAEELAWEMRHGDW